MIRSKFYTLVAAIAIASACLASARTITITVIGKSQSNPVFPIARTGAEDAARDLSSKYKHDIRIDWRTPNDEDVQKQASAIEQAVLSGVDGIAVSCSDVNKITDAINSAVAAGVPVATFDSDAPASKRFVCFSVDSFDCGYRTMEELVKLLQGTGVVAILGGSPNAPNLQLRVAGAKASAAKHPGIKVLDTFFHRETPQDAVAKIEQVMQANPDVTGWALIGGWPLFTEHALKWAPGTVKCVSMDALPAQLAYIRSGHVPVLLHENFYEWGYYPVELLVEKILFGKQPKDVVVFQALEKITADNVDEFEKRSAKWYKR